MIAISILQGIIIDATNCKVDTYAVGRMLEADVASYHAEVVVAHIAKNVDALATGVCHTEVACTVCAL